MQIVPGRGFSDGGLYPTDLSVAQRYAPRPSNYVATRQIELLPGFETGLSDEMVAEIVDPATNPNGSTGMYGGEGSYEAYGYYRYGFNGKENDNEVMGSGNQQDYGMRIYDPRLGRFLSVDPITKQYPELTPYQFASNSPVRSIDLDGMEGWELSTPDANLKRDAEARQAMLNKPQAKDIEILVWNPFRNQAQIGKASVVMANIAIARNNYNSAVGSNIASSPFGAADYMLNPDGGGFAGAAVGEILFSFGGINGRSSVLSRP